MDRADLFKLMFGGELPNLANLSLSVPERINQYTNKMFLLNRLAEFLAKEKAMDSFLVSIQQDFGTPAPYKKRSSKFQLVPQNRVNIETLKQNVDNTLVGKYFLCRCITPPHKMTSVMIVVEDPEGKLAVELALYNYTMLTSTQDLLKILPVGMILAIKNPWFKPALDGGFIVRCDNPTDVVVVSQDVMSKVFSDLEWKGDIPQEHQTLAITASASAMNLNIAAGQEEFLAQKNLGNKCFVSNDFVGAIQCYTQALSIIPQSADVLANRGAAYINMRCYRRAKTDLNLLLEIDGCHVKGIYRQVKCLWGLNAYKDAVDFIKLKLKILQLSKVKELVEIKGTAEILQQQHETGHFDMVKCISERDQKTLDGAEYHGPVKVKNFPNKGRGLIATEAIKPGQLIITSKPFAMHVFSPEKSNGVVLRVGADGMNLPGTEEFIQLIAHKLTLEPECCEEFYNLFAGPELGALDEITNEVDLRRIGQVEQFNAFSHDIGGHFSHAKSDTMINIPKKLGIWTLPSFINHSCSESNCSWQILGDMMFIRAVKPIMKNEEVLISYCQPSQSFQFRQSIFQSHFFECNCSLCELEKGEAKALGFRRRDILKKLKDLNKNGVHMDVGLAIELIARLESLRSENPRLNLVLAQYIVQEIAAILFICKDFKNCLQLTSKTHFVTTDTALAVTAVDNSCNMVGCSMLLKDRKMVNRWVEILKHDLIVAYGCVQVFPFLSPVTFRRLEEFGWNSFLFSVVRFRYFMREDSLLFDWIWYLTYLLTLFWFVQSYAIRLMICENSLRS